MFPNVRVIAGAGGYGFYMIGSDGSVDLTRTEEGGPGAAGRPRGRKRRAGLEEANGRGLGQHAARTDLGVGRRATEAVGDGPLITDDRPLPEYFMPRRLQDPNAPRLTFGALRSLLP